MPIKSVIAAAALLAATAAGAATYDAVADFSSTPTVWSYGTGITGTSFVADTEYHAVCEGDVRISCWQTPTPVSRVPLVAKNVSGSTADIYDTVVMPTDVLNVHPGPATDSIVRFTAPRSGKYRLTGFFELLDVNPSGVNVAVYVGGNSSGGIELTAPAAMFPATPGERSSFFGFGFLAAGHTVDFGVNNDGSFFNDSTGLSATISDVPEPAAWTLLVAGFGLVGGLARRDRAGFGGGRRRAAVGA